MKNTIYPNNIYIKNYELLNSDKYDTGTSLDIFDKEHKLKRDDLARAEYYHWLSIKLNNKEYLNYISDEYKKKLGI